MKWILPGLVTFLAIVLASTLWKDRTTRKEPSEKAQALQRLKKLATQIAEERPELFRKEGVIYHPRRAHVWWNRRRRHLWQIPRIGRDLWVGNDGVIYRRIDREDDFGNERTWWQVAPLHKREVVGIERLERKLQQQLQKSTLVNH